MCADFIYCQSYCYLLLLSFIYIYVCVCIYTCACVCTVTFNILFHTKFKWKPLFPLNFRTKKFLCIFHLPHACYKLRPSRPPSFDFRNNTRTWWIAQALKFLVRQFINSHVTSSLTNSIEHSPWEADSHSASQEIQHVLWNSEFITVF